MEKYLITASACALGASALTFLVCRYLYKRRDIQDNMYETEKYLGRYLICHYGQPDEILPYSFGLEESLDFPKRCSLECIKHTAVRTNDIVPSRALDIGCAVGRSSFELAKRFNQVVGIDFSQSFIDTCQHLKKYGKLAYSVQTEGVLVSEHVAEVDPSVDRSRLSFYRGDACNLPSDLGQFGCVLAANVVCRLPNPYQFLERLPSLVAPGGILVITSPYCWLEKFTPKNLWLGGYKDADGKAVTGYDKLKVYLSQNFVLVEDKLMPYFIREYSYEHQWGVARTTIWKRRQSTS